MLIKYAVAGVAASALLASVAFAQTPSATTDRATTAAPTATADTSSLKGSWRNRSCGLSVYNDGTKGEVEAYRAKVKVSFKFEE